MSTSPKHLEELSGRGVTFGQIDKAVRSLQVPSMEETMLLQPGTLTDRLQRFATIYAGLRPLLSALAALTLLPPSWRSALTLFMKAIEAVIATIDPEADPSASGATAGVA